MPNAFTRREFVNSTLAMISSLGAAPAFLSATGRSLAAPYQGAATAQLPGVPEGRVLVVVQLSGGNDGLNTVAPVGSDLYHKSRPGIGITARDALLLDAKHGIGLHPAMKDLHGLIAGGRGSVIQGVGYPNPNRSHFASMDIWHAGVALERHDGTGWIGRAMDQPEHREGAMPVLAIGAEAPMAGVGKKAAPVSFSRADLFRFTARDLHGSVARQYDQANRAGVLPSAGDADDGSNAAFLMKTSLDAQLASDRVRKAVQHQPQTNWPSHGLARQLRMVASMIRAELPTRVYYVSMGGFDTHANQAGRHQNLLTQFSESMAAFNKELEAIGRDKDVLTLAFSEFGRRVRQNGSGGTDHGAAGPMFLMGPMVKPGLLGSHPSLTDLDRGDLKFNVDFRSIYAAVLEHWMKLDSEPVFGQKFKLANVLA